MAELYGLSTLFADSSLRAYYRLENVNDSSGKGFNLTNTGSVLFNPALYNNGADFGTSNTTKQLVYTAANPMTTATPANMTLCAWTYVEAQPAADTTEQILMVSTSLGTGGAYMNISYRDVGGTKQFEVVTDLSGGINRTTFNLTATLNTWYHIVGVKSSTTTNALYVNAVQQAQTTGTGTDASFAGSTNFIALGADRDNTALLSGIMDDGIIFEKALTQNEIYLLANNSHSKLNNLRPRAFSPGIAR